MRFTRVLRNIHGGLEPKKPTDVFMKLGNDEILIKSATGRM
jgi:hypothetical protein